ncbi:MAG TPA: hypothetical protein DCE44_24995, partial [Verrucomicrobiales bacterium]|nr:hypothetical protein [Verrucomicrobiales bacterium]
IVLPSGEATELTNGNSSVLGNDFDADDDTLEAVLVDGPSHGVLALSSDGTFVYQHGGSDETSDRFTYFVRDGQTKSEATEVKISVFRVKSRVTVEDALVLEWPGQQGNVYQVESRPKDTTTADAPVIVATLTADEDKTMATLIPPDGLSDRSLSVRCVYADSELTADVAIAGAN